MKKILLLTTCLYFLAGCNKDLSKLNIDEKNPDVVPSYSLFSNGQRNLAYFIADTDPNNNIFRLITQQWTQTTYTDESNYDLGTRAVPDLMWGILYRDCLRDFQESKRLIPTDIHDEATQKIQLAIVDINEVYTWNILVNTFGDIPYTEALQLDNIFPKYDDAKTVYYDLLTRLDADIAALDENASSGVFSSADLLYHGDVTKWKKFANSLKLVMGMLIADSDPAKAKAVVESAAPNVFTSNADNATFQFLSIPPNTNPVWVNLVQSQRTDFVPTTTFIGIMQDLQDPRLPYFFTTTSSNDYEGGTPGDGNTYSILSHVTAQQTRPDAPYVWLDYAQVEFTLAEAVERGMNVGGTAQAHYNAAITASIKEWGGTEEEAASYLAQADVNYTTAAGDFKEKIARQEYIALYNRGFDEWTLIRRLDYPALPAPVDALSDFPVRFTYPVAEQNINENSYNAAAAAIGGDDVTTKLFWDKY